MQRLVSPEDTIMRHFDSEGVWVGPRTRKIMFNGEVIDIDEWSEESGISLPDSE